MSYCRSVRTPLYIVALFFFLPPLLLSLVRRTLNIAYYQCRSREHSLTVTSNNMNMSEISLFSVRYRHKARVQNYRMHARQLPVIMWPVEFDGCERNPHFVLPLHRRRNEWRFISWFYPSLHIGDDQCNHVASRRWSDKNDDAVAVKVKQSMTDTFCYWPRLLFCKTLDGIQDGFSSDVI